MDNPIKMDDLGVPQFLETPIFKQGLHFESLGMIHLIVATLKTWVP